MFLIPKDARPPEDLGEEKILGDLQMRLAQARKKRLEETPQWAPYARRIAEAEWDMLKPLAEAWVKQVRQHERDQGVMRCEYCDTPSKQEHYCPNCGAPR